MEAESSHLVGLEAAIAEAIRGIEVGNDRLSQMIARLVNEGAELDGLTMGARHIIAGLAEELKDLPGHFQRLRAGLRHPGELPSAAAEKLAAPLDDLFGRSTMEAEREVSPAAPTQRGHGCAGGRRSPDQQRRRGR